VNRAEGAAEAVGCNEGLGIGTVTDARLQTPSRRRRCEWALIFLPPY
jgi:hypothetical protein